MYLDREEEAVLAGEEGSVRQKAMEILVALGDIYEAERLIEIDSSQLSGVSYKSLGEAGLDWIESMSDAKVSVPTTLNPAGMDLDRWREMGVQEDFAAKQMKIIEVYGRLGATTACSCTPYLLGNVPRPRSHVAWSESSAVCYANSILGAKTNREGGPSALTAAILGKTPYYGYHLDENRRPTLKVKVSMDLEEESDFSALGYWTGRLAKDGIPYFTGISKASGCELKALAASLAASGGVALYHVEGTTPEAERFSEGVVDEVEFGEKNLKGSYGDLKNHDGRVDLVCFGCPHASIEEIKRISELLEGEKVAPSTRLWIFTSVATRSLAERCGYLNAIQRSGGQIYSDCCMIVAPLSEMGFTSMTVNSAKAAIYAPTISKLDVAFGSMKDCVKIATRGYVP